MTGSLRQDTDAETEGGQHLWHSSAQKPRVFPPRTCPQIDLRFFAAGGMANLPAISARKPHGSPPRTLPRVLYGG